jgi:tripartite-type tricarboxylate transporter receptor subunit TctC
MSRTIIRTLTFAVVLLLLPGATLAESYPERRVHIIVPYPPGGGVDGLARPLADRLSRAWNQTVIVENKSGASTIVGSETVARAPKDGYTLLLTSDSSITSNPFLFKKLPLDPMKDLEPVTQLIDLHQMVVVHPSVAANTMQELLAYAKAHPHKLTYGSYGKGSQPNLLFESLSAKTGATFLQVPYRGIAPAILATLQGDVQMTLGGAATTGQYIKAGRMKALAIGRAERLKDFPDIPTLAELGLGGVNPKSWFGLFAPAGTPSEVVATIQSAVSAVFKDPQFKQRFVDAVGYTGVASTPSEFAAFIKRDFDEKRKMIAAAGIQPD